MQSVRFRSSDDVASVTVSRTGPQRSSKELGAFVETADDNEANCTSAFLALATGFLEAGLTAGSAVAFSCCSCCWMSNYRIERDEEDGYDCKAAQFVGIAAS